MFSFSKLFHNPSNARRAARAAGIDFAGVEQRDGGYAVLPIAITMRVAEPAAPEPAKDRSVVRHKEFAVYGPSKIEKPVQFVRQFLAEHGAGLSRKDAIHQLVRAGVTYATARTQYQVWHSSRA